MTLEEMKEFIEVKHPITYNSVKVQFKNGTSNVGFFNPSFTDGDDSAELKEKNKWRFIPNNMAVQYQTTKLKQYSLIIDGELVKKLTLL